MKIYNIEEIEEKLDREKTLTLYAECPEDTFELGRSLGKAAKAAKMRAGRIPLKLSLNNLIIRILMLLL